MRGHTFLAALVATLAVLSGAALGSAAPRVDRDGTLTIREGRGTFVIELRGAVIGRLDRGRLTIDDPSELDGTPVVRGHEWSDPLSDTKTVYGGKGIRFRILGGRFTVRIQGATGVALSVVGRGRAQLRGAGFQEFGLPNGDYSLNGDEFLPIPDEPTWVQVRAPAKP